MIIILFGVAGAGKSLIGHRLAAELGWKFHDADHFHPPDNIVKMRQGVALSDEDRRLWLDGLCRLLNSISSQKEDAILACSVLKESYRRQLALCADVQFVFLRGEYEFIKKRLGERRGHFMNPELLRSQFETLEEPRGEVLVIDVRDAPGEIVHVIKRELKL